MLVAKAERTVDFVWDGRRYSIDLNKKNIAALEKALQPYVAAARTKRGARPSGKGRSRRSGVSGSPSSSGGTGAIREWARANGYEISARGRLPSAVVAAYE